MAIRKRNHGITVCRNGREIDVVKPPTDWFVLSNNYLHAGVEIDFDPILDDDFGVTTNKQGVSINERIWDILKREGVCDEYKRLRSRFENDESVKEQTHDGKKTAEIVMDNAMGLLDNSSKELTVLAQKKGHENLVKIAENISKETGRGIDEVTQDLVIQTQKNRNKIQIKEMIGGPFFIPEQRGGQTVLIINSHHKFFTNVYGARTTSPEARNGIDLLLFAAAYAELRSTAEVQLIYENERRRISDQLNTLLGHLEILKSTAGTDSVSPTDI